MPTNAKILAVVVLASTLVYSRADAQTVPVATVTALADALKDSDADVRRQAAWALNVSALNSRLMRSSPPCATRIRKSASKRSGLSVASAAPKRSTL